MENNKKNKKLEKKSKQLIIIAVALIAVIGISYAWLTTVLNGNKTNYIQAGTLELSLSEGNGIEIDPAVPMSDDNGVAQTNSYDFILKNTGNIKAVYTIYLDQLIDTNVISNDKIKYQLTTEEGDIPTATDAEIPAMSSSATVTSGYLSELATSGTIILKTGTLGTDESPKKYRRFSLKLWIDSEATNADLNAQDTNGDYTIPKEWEGQIRVEASQANIPSDVTVDYSTGKTVTNP